MATDTDNLRGQRFTHVYLDRSVPLGDDELFRRRLGGYCFSNFYDWRHELADYVKQEIGISVPFQNHLRDWEGLFVSVKIHHALDLVTIIWRYLSEFDSRRMAIANVSNEADKWLEFVRRVFQENNLHYTVDSLGGVHFLVDQEFEFNRLSTLRCLEAPRFAGVRSAFEASQRYLDGQPPDTKAAVRSAFEAVEILARLMVDTKNLNKWLVLNELLPIARQVYSHDPAATATVQGLFAGFAEWVDAIHNYRHGQRTEDPVAPPLNVAVHILSSGASYLRWLVEIDLAGNKDHS